MIIANPIYDVVFKKLMENERVAKYFISTMLDEEVESLSVQPQEFTYTDALAGLAVFRLDFVAVINTKEGETKKLLIEIQKAKNEIDLMRFRNYLAEQYKKQDIIDDEKVTLPITTIYILGFKLPNMKTACIHVERQYKDLINNSILTQKNDFIERLTHDSYVVQVRRITGRYKSKLDQLLSIFEQNNFINETHTVKEYLHKTEDEDIKAITAILHHSGTDPKSRREIEIEQEAWRSVNAMFEEKEKVLKKALLKASTELTEKDKELTEKDKELTEKNKELTEKNKALEDQLRLIEDLKNRLKKDE